MRQEGPHTHATPRTDAPEHVRQAAVPQAAGRAQGFLRLRTTAVNRCACLILLATAGLRFGAAQEAQVAWTADHWHWTQAAPLGLAYVEIPFGLARSVDASHVTVNGCAYRLPTKQIAVTAECGVRLPGCEGEAHVSVALAPDPAALAVPGSQLWSMEWGDWSMRGMVGDGGIFVLWGLENEEELHAFSSPGQWLGFAFNFSANGSVAVTGPSGFVIHLHRLPTAPPLDTDAVTCTLGPARLRVSSIRVNETIYDDVALLELVHTPLACPFTFVDVDGRSGLGWVYDADTDVLRRGFSARELTACERGTVIHDQTHVKACGWINATLVRANSSEPGVSVCWP